MSRVAVETDKPANQVGRYMHPEAYGKPASAGINYSEKNDVPAPQVAPEGRGASKPDRDDGE
jgi:hypothetical protein